MSSFGPNLFSTDAHNAPNQNADTDRTKSTELAPNAARAKQVQFVGWFVVVIGFLLLLGPILDGISELRARVSWRRATGFIAAATVQDGSGSHVPGHGSGTRTRYWAKFEVTFKPVDDCGERSTTQDSVTGEITCGATILSHPQLNDADARAWLNRHARGRQTELLYDPRGAQVKFADESLLNVVEWRKFFGGLVAASLGFALIKVTQAKLKEFVPSGGNAT